MHTIPQHRKSLANFPLENNEYKTPKILTQCACFTGYFLRIEDSWEKVSLKKTILAHVTEINVNYPFFLIDKVYGGIVLFITSEEEI